MAVHTPLCFSAALQFDLELLQPQSIFINENCTIALSRFGEYAMVVRSGESPPPYPNDKYVSRKWYSPPERLLGSTVYAFYHPHRRGCLPLRSPALTPHARILATHRVKTSRDMWQVGLVLGEMLKGQPLLAGNSTMHQVRQNRWTHTPTIHSLCLLGLRTAGAHQRTDEPVSRRCLGN